MVDGRRPRCDDAAVHGCDTRDAWSIISDDFHGPSDIGRPAEHAGDDAWGLDILRDVLRRLLAEKFCDVFADSTLCVATTVDPCFKLFPFDTGARVERAKDATLTQTSGDRNNASAASDNHDSGDEQC